MNRLMRVIVLISTLAMLAAGCSPTGVPVTQPAPTIPGVQAATPGIPSSTSQGASIQITYWDPYEGWAQFQSIAKEFRDSCAKQLNLQVATLGGNSESLQAMITAGNAPDVMLLSTLQTLDFTSQGQLLKITDHVGDRNDYLPGVFWQDLSPSDETQECDYSKTDMDIYGAPQSASFLVLLYNKRLFKNAGLDPETPPKSMQELSSYAEQIAKGGADRGFMLTGAGYFTLPFLYAYGGGLYNPVEKRVTVTDTATIDALNFAVSLQQNLGGKAPVPFDPANQYQKAVEAFKTGQVGMIFNGPWAIPDILSSDEFKDIGNLGVAMIPAGPGGQESPMGGSNYAVFAKSKNPTQAAQFITCLNSAENQVKLATQLLMVPTRASAFEQLPKDQTLLGELMQVSRKQMDFVPKESLFANTPFIIDDFTAASNNIFQGNPASQEMEKLSSKWQAKPPDFFICCRCGWHICC